MRDAGIENVLALRGDPPRRRDRVDRHRGRPGVLARADRADPRRVRLRDRRRLLPGGPHPRGLGGERPALLQGEGRRRRALPDHAAVLRQRASTGTSSPAAREIGIDVPIIPGIMPITNFEQIKRFTSMCGATIPAGLLRELEPARRPARRRSPTSASPTRRSSAPTCWPRARPGIHFYTLNRSTATRAILSALRCMAPWRDAVPA